MPRVQQSKIGSIVAFFRTVPLEVMDLAFDLVRDEVQERRGKSQAAKARAKKVAPAAAAAPAPAATAGPTAVPARKGKPGPKAKAKKSHKKKVAPPAPVAEQALPDSSDQGFVMGEEYPGTEGTEQLEHENDGELVGQD